MKTIFLAIIRAYQKIFSPDQGFVSYFFSRPTCRFYPTCSSYAAEAIKKYGAIKGTRMGVRRLLKCHPWNAGGLDPVP